MPSAADLITGALRSLNVIGATEIPSAQDLSLGLTVLNRMIAAWRLQRLALTTVERSVAPLVQGQASYTIGPGGDFNQQRPNFIVKAGAIIDRNHVPPVEVPLGAPVAAADYAGIPMKDLQGPYPTLTYYDHSYDANGRGRIYVWPVPSGSVADLAIYTPQHLERIDPANINDPLVLADGFEEAIHYNLAIRLANEGFSAPIPSKVEALARSSFNNIKYAAVQIPHAKLPSALLGFHGGRADIRTGGAA